MKNRIEGVWRTDGMFSFMDMQALSMFLDISYSKMINLNGFFGDVICGGGYINKLNSKITKETATNFYKHHHELINTDDYYNIPHEDPFIIDNHARRFINGGTILISNMIEQRKPFLDNKIIELVYSLPDEYRLHGKLYNAALLKGFPVFFNDIPSANTGLPINREAGFNYKVLRKIKKILSKHKIIPSTYFIDYKNWIKNDIDFFTGILKPTNSIYREYINKDFYKDLIIPHKKGRKDYSREICWAATVEIWLQQVFNERNPLLYE